MPTSVYETVDVELLDGTKLSMRPLKISLLREFMKKFEGVGEVSNDNDASMDLLIDCVQIALKQYSPDLAENKEKVEDVFDLPAVYKVIEAASGIKLDDQGNLVAAGSLGLN
jgi:inhibitor of KinA sporulation pathway (predicted exonuclease)